MRLMSLNAYLCNHLIMSKHWIEHSCSLYVNIALLLKISLSKTNKSNETWPGLVRPHLKAMAVVVSSSNLLHQKPV